jgi:hypothetical protein
VERCYTTVDLRAVFSNDYKDKGRNFEPIDIRDYNATLIGLTPVAAISLTVDIGNDLEFQVDEQGLRTLIRTLLACLTDLEAAKSASAVATALREKI